MKDAWDSEYVEYVPAKIPWLRKVAQLLCQDWHLAEEIRHPVHRAVDLRERAANMRIALMLSALLATRRV